MDDLARTAAAFVEMAHRIVWCSVATVDPNGRPRSRLLHPYWRFDGRSLVGFVGTVPTPLKRAHLTHSPHASCSYWEPSQDTCVAECRAELRLDEETRREVWRGFASLPPPLGYDPANLGVPGWETPGSPAFAVLRLEAWRLRVFPGSLLRGGGGEVLSWQA